MNFFFFLKKKKKYFRFLKFYLKKINIEINFIDLIIIGYEVKKNKYRKLTSAAKRSLLIQINDKTKTEEKF